MFWRKVLDEGAKTRLIENISSHLINAVDFIQDRAVANFTKCDPDYGRRLKEALDVLRKQRNVILFIIHIYYGNNLIGIFSLSLKEQAFEEIHRQQY